MPRKFQKRDIFLAPVIEHSNRAHLFVADPYEFAPRAAQLSVKRLHPPRRRVEMPLKKFFENVHQNADLPRCHPEPSRVLCGLCEDLFFAFEGVYERAPLSSRQDPGSADVLIGDFWVKHRAPGRLSSRTKPRFVRIE
jgi:hypothetical protein